MNAAVQEVGHSCPTQRARRSTLAAPVWRDTLAGACTGKPWDDTSQLFHFPNRQYSPDMARWTLRDPLGMVDGPNVYGYVMGNPTNYLDPDGRAVDKAAV